jgi:hypothetical protein
MPETPARWYELQLSRVIVPPEVVFRQLAHETVLLNIRTGTYHGTDAVGARFFEAARDATNVKEACDALAREYEQPIERIRSDFLEFVEAMAERGLLMLQSPGGGQTT